MAESCESPLKLRFCFLAKRYIVHPFFELPYEDHIFVPHVSLELGCFSQSCPNPSALLQDIVNTIFKNHVHSYTDGSKSKDSRFAGCASVCPSANYSHNWKISSAVFILSIESIAILLTLDYILKHRFQYFVIFSDTFLIFFRIFVTKALLVYKIIEKSFKKKMHKEENYLWNHNKLFLTRGD